MEKLPTKNSYNIRIVTNILTKALKLWLKSQVSQVSQLEVEIKASDGQILSGCIPRVSITASDAVYQGLNITRIQLAAENIQVNIGSILKGKQLKLLQTVPVFGDLVVDEQDLNSSLSSELLSRALGSHCCCITFLLSGRKRWSRAYNKLATISVSTVVKFEHDFAI